MSRVHPLRVSELRPGEVRITGPEAHHLARVLRVRPGVPVRAFDGRGLEATGRVEAVLGDGLVVHLDAPRPSVREAALRVTLAVALLKGDKLADVVRMGTELGVVAVRPFVSRRADLPVLSAAKLARLRRVAQEAAKQSGRSVVPDVHEAVPLGSVPLGPFALLADPAAPARLRDALPEDAADVTLLTGPEGGFTEAEVAALQAAGAVPVRLGERILRAETAPIALAAALLIPEAL